ncbi:MAG: cysteine desulfurase [Candidatus Yonathbacteria bacterium]|nr:cysteine desulfurase [Candidatus Yonathbacteria bacterium]
MKRVYLDHAAATPLDPRVFAAMKPFMTKEFGNPGALYREGVVAKNAVLLARKKVAQILFAHPDEIIFTGSGTESNNLAIEGVVKNAREKHCGKNPHIITSAIEHPSVLSVCQALERRGIAVSYIGVDGNGIIKLDELKKAFRKETMLVSVMYANNEIGTVEPIREIAKIIRMWRKQHNTSFPYFHADACQAANYLPLHIERLGVDLLTLNGSKIYGPKGVGTLFVRRGVSLSPIMYGGGQERGLRPGTENIAGIVGFAEALLIAEKMKEKESKRLTALRDYFVSSVLKKIPGALLNGDVVRRLPNNINISIPGIESEHIIIELDAHGVAASARSACKSMDEEGSHVIMALGRNTVGTESGVRFTLGRSTTKKDVDYAVRVLSQLVKKLKNGGFKLLTQRCC